MHRKLERSVTLTGIVPEIYVSLIGADSQPQLQENSINNHHPSLSSGDICCDGYTENEPPQSPLSIFSTNEDSRYNLLSRSLPSSTDYLNSNNEDNILSRSLPSSTDYLHSNNGDAIPRAKPSEVDKRPSSWSEGATVHITVNVSPSKSSETLPETIEHKHHETSCIPKKDSYKSLSNSTSKLSDVSLSPVAEGVSTNEMETEIDGDVLMMKPLSGAASDDNEMPPLSELEIMNKPKAAESKIHRRFNVHFIPLHCDMYHNHNMSLSYHMHSPLSPHALTLSFLALFRSLSLSSPHPHTHTYTQGASKHVSKLKRLGSKFGLQGKRSKSKKCQERITNCTWTVEKSRFLQCIWEHRHHEYLKHSEPIPIDIECGELNPYVSLRLYPFGLFEDENKSMTLLLNPIVPDKCPPLSEDANFTLSWRIFALEADAENLLEQSKKPVKVQFVQGIVYVHKFFPHALLQQHKCEELKICIVLSTGYSCLNTHTVMSTCM